MLPTNLKVRHGKRYRAATRDEILDAAASFMVAELRGAPLWFPVIGAHRFADQMCTFTRMREIEASFRASQVQRAAEVIRLVPAAPIAPEFYWLAVA